MKDIIIEKVNKKIYYEKLNNGLQVYLLPNIKVKGYHVSFMTKYGSIHTSFNYNNKDIDVPNGIAHFLEHKVFEQEDGIDPFTFFSKSGSDCNAYTSYDQTCYLFSGSSNIKKNMNYLLDYVQKPCFTDKNVEKEKGIIEQELLMYEDMYENLVNEKLMGNIFNKSNYKYSVGGKVEDIMTITKEMLYDCYNTFYNPNNMYVIATGNFNYKELLNTIKDNQSKKTFKEVSYSIKEEKEEDKVGKEYEKLSVGISAPIINIGIKLPVIKKDIKYRLYMHILVSCLFGKTTDFQEEIKDKKLIDSPLYSDILETYSHNVIILDARSTKYNELINKVKEYLSDINIDEKTFNMIKKVKILKYIDSFDSTTKINSEIIDNILYEDKYINDMFSIIKSLNYKDFMNIIKNTDFSNVSSFVID